MERRRLGTLLREAGLATDLALDPGRALSMLEERATLEERAWPQPSREVAAALSAVLDRLAAGSAPPDGCAPVDLGAGPSGLYRWDSLSAGWAARTEQGRLVLIRTLRPEYSQPPASPEVREAARRWLLREGQAIARVLRVELDEERAALMVPLVGQPLSPRRGDALVRPLLTGLAAIERWERAGLGLPWLLPEELRVVDERVSIACLWVSLHPSAGASAPISALASALVDPGDDTALAATVHALETHPPDTVAEAARRVRSALAEHLAARRHGLAARWRETWHRSQELRLREVVERLYEVVSPPSGRGAVGVDLEGRITVVEADGHTVRWGPERAVEIVFDRDQGFRPPVARRLLRARAVSPPNPSLDARVGGNAAATDAICRWVAAGLRLRTVQMLLDRDRGCP